MSRVDILFKTDRFNLTVEKENFINPECYGEDLAQWLRVELKSHGMEVDEEGQEDFGWFLGVKDRGDIYFIGISGISDDDKKTSNLGEWRLMIEKKRSLLEKLLGKNKFDPECRLVQEIKDLLNKERFIAVRIE